MRQPARLRDRRGVVVERGGVRGDRRALLGAEASRGEPARVRGGGDEEDCSGERECGFSHGEVDPGRGDGRPAGRPIAVPRTTLAMRPQPFDRFRALSWYRLPGFLRSRPELVQRATATTFGFHEPPRKDPRRAVPHPPAGWSSPAHLLAGDRARGPVRLRGAGGPVRRVRRALRRHPSEQAPRAPDRVPRSIRGAHGRAGRRQVPHRPFAHAGPRVSDPVRRRGDHACSSATDVGIGFTITPLEQDGSRDSEGRRCADLRAHGDRRLGEAHLRAERPRGPGEANTVAPIDVEANIMLTGNVCGDASFVCGDVAGSVVQAEQGLPRRLDVHVHARRGGRNVPDPVINCEETPAKTRPPTLRIVRGEGFACSPRVQAPRSAPSAPRHERRAWGRWPLGGDVEKKGQGPLAAP